MDKNIWYEENIEEPVRDLVKYLRNRGLNTQCSCGHKMYINCDYSPDGLIKKLHDMLYCYFHKKKLPITYTIEIIVEVKDGHVHSFLNIKKIQK